MTYNDGPLIAIDAGHGGWDNGASWQGRLEKDDNLALALEVQKQLLSQKLPVLMTRDTDVYVTLEDRVLMANRAGADLFISLHRNSYIEQTPYTNGVENFIYLTAPEETTGRAAQYVLDSVVDVGVQSNRGVARGNYYVVRRTVMPAMLLEMGFIINEIDNALFDEHLVEYAAAIAKGAMQYFGLTFREIPGITPPLPPSCPPCPDYLPVPDYSPYPNCPAPPENLPNPPEYLPNPPEYLPEYPPCPICPDGKVMEAQLLLNKHFGLNMPLTGILDDTTMHFATKALQKALNMDFNACLTVDGNLCGDTLAAFPNVRLGQRGNVVFVIQALLQLNSYDTGPLDGIFGIRTQTAVQMFQRDNCLVPDGVVNRKMISRLLGY